MALDGGDEYPEGRRLQVGVEPGWLVLAAAVSYLVPVAAFVAGAVLANLQWPKNDPAALCGGLLMALSAVFFLARNLPHRIIRPPLWLVDRDSPLESGGVGGQFRNEQK